MMSTATGFIVLFIIIISLLVYFANDSYEKKLKCELNNLNQPEDVEIKNDVKVITLSSRFDHLENVSTLTTDDFVKKELPFHVTDVIDKSSKKHLVRRTKKTNTAK